MSAMLEVSGLEVHYGGATAVRDLSLEVWPSEIIGLIGPNGAGKTSTLNAIVGAIPSAAGDVKLDGRSIRDARTEDIIRSGVALVPEGRRIFAELTVEENLRLGLAGRSSGGSPRASLGRVYELFPVVRDARRRPAGTLSGGQQQQLAIARALVAEPRLLLLDEPSLGLAPKIVDVVFDTLATIREQGVTILLVEQRAQRTVAFADRTYLMANGRVRLELTPKDADDTARMVAAYFS
jgi:branched-chain amino acid transport system ATP-binding protein